MSFGLKNRHYFVGNSEGTDQVEPMYRTCWRQVSEGMDYEPDCVDLETPHKKVIKTYYDVCTDIDCHNSQNQEDLYLERIFRNVTWWKRVCISVFGMIVIDTENVYSEVVHQIEVDKIPYAFFTNLSHKIIFNEIDRPSSQRRQGMGRH